MADFSNIIEEINTNLPDNNNQSITAAKLRTTLIDLTNQIDSEQDDFESQMDTSFGVLQGQVETALDNLIVDNLTSNSSTTALSANQGRVLNDRMTQLPDELSNPQTITQNLTNADTIDFYIGKTSGNYLSTGTGIILPVSSYSIVEITANSNRNTNFGFLKSYPSDPVSEQPAPLVDGTSVISIPSGTTATYTAPQGSKYLYFKKSESGVSQAFTPASVKITAVKFATYPELEDVDSKLIPYSVINPTADKQISYYMGTTNEQGVSVWYSISSNGGSWSSLSEVEAGGILEIKANTYHNCQYAFLTGYNDNTQSGDAALLVEGTSRYSITLGTTQSNIVVPEGTKYLYIKLQEGDSTFNPIYVKYLPPQNVKVVSENYYDDTEYDTWIEENYYYLTNPNNNGSRTAVKGYNVTPGETYKVILTRPTATQGGYGVYYYNASGILISSEFPASGSSTSTSTLVFDVMEDITVPSGCAKIYIKYYQNVRSGGSTPTTYGMGALMKPLRKDGTIPTNALVYCVSRISRINNLNEAYGESQSETSHESDYVWSAWCFKFPKDIKSLTGSKIPMAAYFHGQSGFDSAEHMGYNHNSANTTFINELTEKGVLVFDVNGSGVSCYNDNYSTNWGGPMAIATAKKAYEILVDRFNGRRGFMDCGISMGGAIAKSYALTYPQDVVGCALLAPTEIGLTVRGFNTEPSGTPTLARTSFFYNWGFTTQEDFLANRFKNLLGYCPLVKPAVINEDDTLSNMSNPDDYTVESMTSDETGQTCFWATFPVNLKIWHGTGDTNAAGGVDYNKSTLLINTLRNAGCNAVLRSVNTTIHSLCNVDYVRKEYEDYIFEKLNIKNQ